MLNSFIIQGEKGKKFIASPLVKILEKNPIVFKY